MRSVVLVGHDARQDGRVSTGLTIGRLGSWNGAPAAIVHGDACSNTRWGGGCFAVYLISGSWGKRPVITVTNIFTSDACYILTQEEKVVS